MQAENDSLREKLQKTAVETEAQAEELEQRITVCSSLAWEWLIYLNNALFVHSKCHGFIFSQSMSAKMKRIEEDRERELTDHGSVLAEMQQRYAKERANAAQMERQVGLGSIMNFSLEFHIYRMTGLLQKILSFLYHHFIIIFNGLTFPFFLDSRTLQKIARKGNKFVF